MADEIVRRYPRRYESPLEPPQEPARPAGSPAGPEAPARRESALERELARLRVAQRELDQKLAAAERLAQDVRQPRRGTPPAVVETPRRPPRAVTVVERPAVIVPAEPARGPLARRSVVGADWPATLYADRMPRNHVNLNDDGHLHRQFGLTLRGTKTIASGVLSVRGSGYYVVAAESGTSDTLDTISDGQFNGQVIQLIADGGDTITLANSAFDLQLVDGANFVMSGTETITLMYVGAGLWRELARGLSGWLDSAHTAAADPHTGYILESLLDAQGDLIQASAADTPAKLTMVDGEYLRGKTGTGVEYAPNPPGAVLHVVSPTARKYAFFHTTRGAATIKEVIAVIQAGTNVVFNMGQDVNIFDATPVDVWSADKTVTSTTTGTSYTTFDDATVPVDTHVWIEIVSVSGAVTDFIVYCWYEYD